MAVICGTDVEYDILHRVCVNRRNISSNIYKITTVFLFTLIPF